MGLLKMWGRLMSEELARRVLADRRVKRRTSGRPTKDLQSSKPKGKPGQGSK